MEMLKFAQQPELVVSLFAGSSMVSTGFVDNDMSLTGGKTALSSEAGSGGHPSGGSSVVFADTVDVSLCDGNASFF